MKGVGFRVETQGPGHIRPGYFARVLVRRIVDMDGFERTRPKVKILVRRSLERSVIKGSAR